MLFVLGAALNRSSLAWKIPGNSWSEQQQGSVCEERFFSRMLFVKSCLFTNNALDFRPLFVKNEVVILHKTEPNQSGFRKLVLAWKKKKKFRVDQRVL